MKKTTRLFLAALTALSLSSGLHAGHIYANGSGEWDSDIWAPKYGQAPESGLRPESGDIIWITGVGRSPGAPKLTKGSYEVENFAINFPNASFELNGADATLTVKNLSVVRNQHSGKMGIKAGTLNITNCLAVGGAFGSAGKNDTGTGVFTQDGGTVNVSGSMGLNLAGGEKATGTYTLNGGALNIADTGPNACIWTTGKGSLVWTGGTLNAARTKVSLPNTGSGDLNPGGAGKVGQIQLAAPSVTYRQGADARMTVDFTAPATCDTLTWQAADAAVILDDNTSFYINPIGGAALKTGDKLVPIKASKITLGGKIRVFYNGKQTDAITAKVNGQQLELTATATP